MFDCGAVAAYVYSMPCHVSKCLSIWCFIFDGNDLLGQNWANYLSEIRWYLCVLWKAYWKWYWILNKVMCIHMHKVINCVWSPCGWEYSEIHFIIFPRFVFSYIIWTETRWRSFSILLKITHYYATLANVTKYRKYSRFYTPFTLFNYCYRLYIRILSYDLLIQINSFWIWNIY